MEIIILYTKKSNYWSQNGWSKERLCLARCNSDWRWQSKLQLLWCSYKQEANQDRKWWQFLRKKSVKSKDNDQIKWTSFMFNLHSCPSSSASLERWFSTFGFVWSKTRNRLGQEKAMKLVKIYRALRSDDSNPFSFLHTFSFFLYFHMLSSSLYLVFNIHYYIITWL